MEILIFLLVLAGLSAVLIIPSWNRRRRRRQLLNAPFPAAWEAVLQKHLRPYGAMPEELRRQVRGIVQVLMAEKRFEGCGGLEVTEEMRVTILGQAAMLLLNRPTRFYPRLVTIYVYPGSYVAPSREFDGLVVTEEESVRLGESWQHGPVVLAWEDVLRDVRGARRGHNVVLHEFAHQLDQEDGEADGTPILDSSDAYPAWAQVMEAEFERLQEGGRSVIARYGAEDPAEFFAAATEAFFEKTELLQAHHRTLYEALKGYYKVDPLEWYTE